MDFAFLASTTSILTAFLNAPIALVAGNPSLPNIAGTLGVLLLAAGLGLEALKPERRALWLVPLILAGLASPAVLGLARSSMGWFGMLFALLAGLGALLIWTAILANDADRRAPFWLVGLGTMSFTGFAGLIGVMLVWGAG